MSEASSNSCLAAGMLSVMSCTSRMAMGPSGRRAGSGYTATDLPWPFPLFVLPDPERKMPFSADSWRTLSRPAMSDSLKPDTTLAKHALCRDVQGDSRPLLSLFSAWPEAVSNGDGRQVSTCLGPTGPVRSAKRLPACRPKPYSCTGKRDPRPQLSAKHSSRLISGVWAYASSRRSASD